MFISFLVHFDLKTRGICKSLKKWDAHSICKKSWWVFQNVLQIKNFENRGTFWSLISQFSGPLSILKLLCKNLSDQEFCLSNRRLLVKRILDMISAIRVRWVKLTKMELQGWIQEINKLETQDKVSFLRCSPKMQSNSNQHPIKEGKPKEFSQSVGVN